MLNSPPSVSRPKLKKTAPAKRRRGGQPGNRNARKSGLYSVHHPGPLAGLRIEIESLNHGARSMLQGELDKQIASLRGRLGDDVSWEASLLRLKLAKIMLGSKKLDVAAILKHSALTAIAQDPLSYIESSLRESAVVRDADSFFPVSKKSARNSPIPAEWGALPPGHPKYATNLTDDQWEILAPLIPPDPHADWLSGEPPVIIAANRWKFSRYAPTGEFQDFVIIQEYRQVLERLPVVQPSSTTGASSQKRGRPRERIPVRAVLDALLWKLTTAHNWDDLPGAFPPMRLVRKYYRRLFLSGRLYTLLLALYNHLRLERGVYIYELFEQGIFTTTPSQNIALAPGVQPDSTNCTALLFMQLAREAYTRLDRIKKEEKPLHPVLPVFKGDHPRTTAWLPSPPEPDALVFVPLQESLVWKNWQKLERADRHISRRVSKLVRAVHARRGKG